MPTIAQLVKNGRQKVKVEDQEPCLESMSTEEGSVRKGLYYNSQETQLGP